MVQIIIDYKAKTIQFVARSKMSSRYIIHASIPFTDISTEIDSDMLDIYNRGVYICTIFEYQVVEQPDSNINGRM
jgi:hypothetical protein